jgi:hypothetical protein
MVSHCRSISLFSGDNLECMDSISFHPHLPIRLPFKFVPSILSVPVLAVELFYRSEPPPISMALCLPLMIGRVIRTGRGPWNGAGRGL